MADEMWLILFLMLFEPDNLLSQVINADDYDLCYDNFIEKIRHCNSNELRKNIVEELTHCKEKYRLINTTIKQAKKEKPELFK